MKVLIFAKDENMHFFFKIIAKSYDKKCFPSVTSQMFSTT